MILLHLLLNFEDMETLVKSKYSTWYHPYKPAKEYQKKAAYFSMEFGIDQALNIYSGGLGYLAGSHMKSGFELKQNMIGIGMLWKYGYYDQGRNEDQTLRTEFIEKTFGVLPAAVCLANNHIMDYGDQGYLDTITILKKKNSFGG